MTLGINTNTKNTDRVDEHKRMLEEALSRPGVGEILEIYENWQKCDRKLDTYRAATQKSERTITTDHTNSR